MLGIAALQMPCRDVILDKEVRKMKKKGMHYFLGLLLAGVLMGCSGSGQQETLSREMERTPEDIEIQEYQERISEIDPMRELREDLYGDFQEKGGEIAFVSDGTVMDKGYNQAIYEGIETYALSAGVSFSCYLVEEDTLEGHLAAVKEAVLNQAKLVVCAGYDFQETIGELQEEYSELSFLLIDGEPVDAQGDPVEIGDNVHCVSFQEEEAGYLAGYMTVLEGYRSLGFIGGKEEPAVIRYGYGYLQGIDDAARELELEDVTVNYWYAGTFQPTQEVYDKAVQWYAQGTQVIFACGGFLQEAVLDAADREKGMLIGVDVDQNQRSERFLTSAMKDLANAVIISLDDYYAEGGKWSEEFAGQSVRYGVEDNCAGIPVLETEWRFRNVTMKEFYELYKQVKQGEISVSDQIHRKPRTSVVVNGI